VCILLLANYLNLLSGYVLIWYALWLSLLIFSFHKLFAYFIPFNFLFRFFLLCMLCSRTSINQNTSRSTEVLTTQQKGLQLMTERVNGRCWNDIVGQCIQILAAETGKARLPYPAFASACPLPGTVFQNLSASQTPPKLLSGIARHFR